MYLDSIAFKAMESGLKGLSMKQQIHTQNIANIDTPDYKYKSISFENALSDAKEKGKGVYIRKLTKKKKEKKQDKVIKKNISGNFDIKI